MQPRPAAVLNQVQPHAAAEQPPGAEAPVRLFQAGMWQEVDDIARRFPALAPQASTARQLAFV